MSRLQTLPPDLRASLSLLVGRGKRYAEIAALLRIGERSVHDRAHAALALLAPRQAGALDAAQREQVGEYMLGQADAEQRAATASYLERSDAARAWAAALAEELGSLGGELPAIPTAAPAEDGGAPAPAAPSSRRGGAILLGALGAVVVVAAVLILTLGGGSSPSAPATASDAGVRGAASSGSSTPTAPAASTTAPSASGRSGRSGKSSGKSASEPHLDATLPLAPPNSSSKALGLVEVLAEGNEHAFILAAEHLPPTHGFHYAAWLYNTPDDAYFLGGGTNVGSNGILKAAQGLPSNATRYATLVLTEEHETHPKQPGPVVLSGPFKE